MTCSTKEIGWDEVREKIVDFPLAFREALGSALARGEIKKFHTAKYPYGQLIVEGGQFRPPCDPNTCAACADLMEAASYSSVPLAAILGGSAEIFVESPTGTEGQHLVPIKMLGQTELFGVFETIDTLLKTTSTRGPWCVSAGARSIWIICPLGDSRLPELLGELTDTDIDWNETDPHWKLVETATRDRHPWNCEVIIFPQSVVKLMRRSTPLFTYLLEIGWRQSARLRDAATEDVELLKLANQVLRRMKVPQGELYHYRTIRHFQEMIGGVVPVFQSSNNVSPSGPFHGFAEMLTQVVRQTKSSANPVILQPGHLQKPGDTGYYSFRCPSVPGHLPTTTFAFSEIAEAYRDIFQRLRREDPASFGTGDLQFFVRPTPSTRIPTGLKSVKDLPASDFYGATESAKRFDGLYTNSPFLVSGVRICRTHSERSDRDKVLQIRQGLRGQAIDSLARNAARSIR